MANAHVEHDFFGMEKGGSSSMVLLHQQPQPRLDRRQSFRGISRINPEIVKSVIAAAGKPPSMSVPASPAAAPDHLPLFAQLPVYQHHPSSRQGSSEKEAEEAPMTIFYKGKVSVFDLPKDKAEFIMKFAMEKSTSMDEGQVAQSPFNSQNDNLLDGLSDGDLPIKRKKSLQRFFEKRKERLISVSPYPIDHMAQQYQKTSA